MNKSDLTPVDSLEFLHAEYGAQLMRSLGEKLAGEFGQGFEVKNLRRMVQFAQAGGIGLGGHTFLCF